MSYDWSPCDGCYLNNLTCYNVRNGDSFTPVCKSYKCQKHGWLAGKKLEKALTRHFSKFNYIRLWTFTITNRLHHDTALHYKDLSKIWKYFITELRRNSILPNDYHQTQYVRVAEPHKSGYWHFHVLVDRYLEWHFIYSLWRSACKRVLQATGKLGHVNVRGIKNSESAAKYVVKYVMKSSQLADKHQKIWTKSARTSIYPEKSSAESYVIWDEARKIWLGAYDVSNLTCIDITTSSQNHQTKFEFELDIEKILGSKKPFR